MEEFSVGDAVGLYVNGVRKDRGRVLEVIAPGIYKIGWEHGRISQVGPRDDIRREPRFRARAWIGFLELQVFGEGLTEEEFRGGGKYRGTDHPWPVAEEHKVRLREFLEANGFDPGRRVWAQEQPDRDGFGLAQYDDD